MLAPFIYDHFLQVCVPWTVKKCKIFLMKNSSIHLPLLKFWSHSLLRFLESNCIFIASPLFGDAYNDRQLTLNLELWVKIFLCVDMFPYEDSEIVSVRLSVRSYPEKINHPSFVNISPTIVIDTSMERSSQILKHGRQKFEFLIKCLPECFCCHVM